MKKIIFAIIALVLVAAGVCAAFFMNHTKIGDAYVHNGRESLDFTGLTLEDPQVLYGLRNLKQLNLKGTGITEAEYEALQAALPNCQIAWLVPFQGQYYPTDTQSLTITSLSPQDMDTLEHLPYLQTIDATGCQDYENLLALQASRPGCTIRYSLELDGQVFPENATSLQVNVATVEELENALALLPQVKELRVTGCKDALGLQALAAAKPGIDIVYDIYLGDAAYSSNAASITLEASNATQLHQLLPCFTDLTEVTIEGDSTGLDMHTLADTFRNVEFHYSFPLLGQSVHTDQEFVDLSGIKMENTLALEQALPYFHKLTQVDMINCGISDEDMAALNDRHPETLFVWTVKIARETFRTDIKVFYPTGLELSPDDSNIKNLKYCTQLEALDLGHFELSDCSFVEYMPKMKYLVLAIGTISDLRPIGTLKELRHLELFMTEAQDYWPLVNCTQLEDLNLAFTGHGDITPLLQMPWLKKLWFCKHFTTDEEFALFAKYLPNTTIIYESNSSTNRGWRYGVNYYEMRDALGTYDMP